MIVNISRRRFLTKAATASAIGIIGAQVMPRAFASDEANDRINVGVIGLGWRGGELLTQIGRLNDVHVKAVCDVDATLLNKAHKDFPKAEQCIDLRRVIDDPEIDAVVIATCNHWHCLAAIWACEAGKDVYVEKPISHGMWEGRQLVNAANKFGCIVQTGTQQRSDPMQEEIREFLHKEKTLGGIREVVVVRFGTRGSIGRRSTPLALPSKLDYELWLGPAKNEPIYRDKLHYDWHWDWNTGNGECANWGVHVLDDVRNVVFNDRVTLPLKVACGGGRLVWNDAGSTPNVQLAYVGTGDVPVVFALSNLPRSPETNQPLRYGDVDSGYVVHCEGGSYHGFRGRGVALDRDGRTIRTFSGDSGGGHLRNFFDAVRSRDGRSLKASAEVGHWSAGWAHLLNAAYRSAENPGLLLKNDVLDQSAALDDIRSLLNDHLDANCPKRLEGDLHTSSLLSVDVDQEVFKGDFSETANRYLVRREYRSPYIVPAINS